MASYNEGRFEGQAARSPRSSATGRLVLWSGLLVVYGNGVALADRYLFPGAWPFAAVLGPVFVALLIHAALRRERIAWKELGIHPSGAISAGAVGLLAGLALAGAALLFLRLPVVVQEPITYRLLADATAVDKLVRILVTMPLDTVFPEEVAFRGLLLALFLRHMTARAAVLRSSVVFMLWHAVVNYHTLSNTNLGEAPVLLVLGVGGAHIGVFIGGVAFCLLRLRTRHVAAPLVAHWTVNGGILLGI